MDWADTIAGTLVDDWQNGSGVWIDSESHDPNGDLVFAVAAALRAERERCVQFIMNADYGALSAFYFNGTSDDIRTMLDKYVSAAHR